jgi:pyridoxamine 5'-phosphate oxidase
VDDRYGAQVRTFLRALPVFDTTLPDFDPEMVPQDPGEWFSAWIRDAVDRGVAEPHAMTLSTVDSDGMPDARVLTLKDVDDSGWWFATNAASPKGDQLQHHPAAALTFSWPLVGRQIRVRGPVSVGSTTRNAEDFQARSVGARGIALVSQVSRPLLDRQTCLDAVGAAVRTLADQPDLVAPGWCVYCVAPTTVEFWQARADRLHSRVRYRRNGAAAWHHELLWP